jgi:hypothetical protein
MCYHQRVNFQSISMASKDGMKEFWAPWECLPKGLSFSMSPDFVGFVAPDVSPSGGTLPRTGVEIKKPVMPPLEDSDEDLFASTLTFDPDYREPEQKEQTSTIKVGNWTWEPTIGNSQRSTEHAPRPPDMEGMSWDFFRPRESRPLYAIPMRFDTPYLNERATQLGIMVDEESRPLDR